MPAIPRLPLAVLLVLVAASCLAAAAPAATTAVRALSTPLDPDAAPSGLFGVVADVGGDPGNWCFDSFEQGAFSAGDSIALSLAWNDVVDDSPGVESYTVTWGLRPGPRPILLGPFACDFDLSAFQPGTAVGLCCAFFSNPLPSPPQATSVDWGGRVVGPGGETVQGLVGSFDVSP